MDETDILDARKLVRPDAIGIGDYAMDSHAVSPKTDWTTADMGEGEFYLMDHSTAIIVMNPDFEYAGVLNGAMQPDEMVARLKDILANGA